MGPVTVEVTRSSLTHAGAKRTFELAEKAPVLIKGGKGDAPDGVLMSAEQYEAERRFTRNLYLVTRALEKGAEAMPDLEGMQWSKLFSVADRRRMLGQLVESARASFERNDPTIFNAMWKGWVSSAQAMSDPEMMALLTGPVDHANTVPLSRP